MAIVIPKRVAPTAPATKPIVEAAASRNIPVTPIVNTTPATVTQTHPNQPATNNQTMPAVPVVAEPATNTITAASAPEIVTSNALDDTIAAKLSELTAKLEAMIPDVRQEMIVIHKALAKDPAQVTVLTPEQRAIIFAGYSRLSGIELVAKAAAKKGPKKDANISVDMFE